MSTLPGLIETLRNALRSGVAPELKTDNAHGQLAGVIDILDKIERMAVWSPALLRERIEVLQAGCDALSARAAMNGVAVPASVRPALATHATQAEIESALRSAEMRVARITDWLFQSRPILPEPLRGELDALLRATLRDALKVERRLTARADLSGMTRASGG